jgi:hypothetical protein
MIPTTESVEIISQGLDSIGSGLWFIGLVFLTRMFFGK